MRAADFAVVRLIRQLVQLTKSYGLAVILSALVVKLVLLPLDWQQTSQSRKLRQIQPEVNRLKDEHADYRMYLSETRKLYADAGIRPLSVLTSILLQIPIFITVFLVIQSTPVFAGQSFLWIPDLSGPDRLAQIPSLPGLGSDLNLLPWLLMGSVWLFAMITRCSGQSKGVLGRIVWLFLAVGIGVLTYRWSSALLIFTIALLWFGILIRRAFMMIRQPEHRPL
jgi:YidC/Oxa1 family membrane protein insertase